MKVMDLEKADLTALEATGWKAPTPVKLKAGDGVTDVYGLLSNLIILLLVRNIRLLIISIRDHKAEVLEAGHFLHLKAITMPLLN
jgi:hypothetical protein